MKYQYFARPNGNAVFSIFECKSTLFSCKHTPSEDISSMSVPYTAKYDYEFACFSSAFLEKVCKDFHFSSFPTIYIFYILKTI